MLTDVAGREAVARPDGALSVAAAAESDRPAWDAFVTANPRAVGYHEWAWRDVIGRTFGHECIYLMARQKGAIQGVLPLVAIKSRLFGRTMTSLPFVNYGGVLAEEKDAARALIAAATDAARARGCRHVELRHFDRQFPDLPYKQHKVTMRLPLQPGMWERIDRKVRNQVRKAEKSQLSLQRGGAELLGDFYTVFARNM